MNTISYGRSSSRTSKIERGVPPSSRYDKIVERGDLAFAKICTAVVQANLLNSISVEC